MNIITSINAKGGCGKSTIAMSLASGLALRGYSTLLIDMDPQAQVTQWLGLGEGISLGRRRSQCLAISAYRDGLFLRGRPSSKPKKEEPPTAEPARRHLAKSRRGLHHRCGFLSRPLGAILTDYVNSSMRLTGIAFIGPQGGSALHESSRMRLVGIVVEGTAGRVDQFTDDKMGGLVLKPKAKRG